ncbi:MAG: DNA internalization-related competence protein ComEC/Rec2 [Betaproteobacteria bacterium]|nr:DNA internalization-related competence protein ComEC/Rec2 [Betaproteobacteria bacterium]
MSRSMTPVGPALAWVAGTVLLQLQPALPSGPRIVQVAAAAAACVLAWVLLERHAAWNGARAPGWAGPGPAVAAARAARAALLLAAAGLGGFGWSAAWASIRIADQLPVAWERRDIEVVGVVAEMVQRTERGVRFAFDVEQVLTDGATVPRRLMLSWYGTRQARRAEADEDVVAGQPRAPGAAERWWFVVRLRRPHGSVNPHGFDVEAWLLERNLRATGHVRRSVARVDPVVQRPGYLVERARESIRARFERTLSGAPYAGVLAALAIGDQRAIPVAQWEMFTRTGINHLMSISGLHVTMVAALAFWLAQAGWRRSPALCGRLPARRAAVLAGLAAAFGYALLAGFSVPTRRTVFMLAVVAAALWRARRIRAAGVLGGALVLVTVLDPWAVLATGFWLSFGAVALLMTVSAGRIGRPPPVPGCRPCRAIVDWSRVQWAITIGMVPATLALFSQVSLVSPIANAIAIPLIGSVVVPIAVVAAVLPLPGLLQVAHAITAATLVPIAALAELPWAVWVQPAPPAWAAALALAGIVWWRMPAGWPARWLGLVTLLPVLVARPAAFAPGTVEVTLLDVGHGLALVARTAGHVLVYDTGPAWSSEADAGSRIVLPYLRGEGIRRIDALVVSHDDIDHSGGAVSLLRALPVGKFLSSLPPGHPAHAFVLEPLLCNDGQSWNWDGVDFRIVHPPWESHSARVADNERSCVLQVEAGGQRLLVTGDIGAASEARLLDSRRRGAEEALRADVLLVPHHGSASSSTPAFVEAVAPRLVLMPIGYRNRFGHPRPEVIERYRRQRAEVVRTDESGAVRLVLGGDDWRLQRERARVRRYWRAAPPVETAPLRVVPARPEGWVRPEGPARPGGPHGQ